MKTLIYIVAFVGSVSAWGQAQWNPSHRNSNSQTQNQWTPTQQRNSGNLRRSSRAVVYTQGNCQITNGIVNDCGVQRPETEEDRRLHREYLAAYAQWQKDMFPPGFPFVQPTVKPVFPMAPRICKNC